MEKKAIYFFTEEVSYTLRDKKKIRDWILTTIKSEGYDGDNINLIFCSDEYLRKTNLEYLKHDTYTDIITFDNSDKANEISGDIFISIERVKENAKIFNVSISEELYRVMIHGILHLIGFDDKTKKEKELMKAKEYYYISLLPKFIQ